MGQQRLNYNILCYIHKNHLINVDLNIILKQFISRTDIRCNIFGNR